MIAWGLYSPATVAVTQLRSTSVAPFGGFTSSPGFLPVFARRTSHASRKFVRHAMSYYQLATTGGASRLRGPRHGEVDHLVWVTMTKDGPIVANLLVDGILADNLLQ